MEIRKLEKLTGNPAFSGERPGYSTDKIFVVSAIETGTSFEFVLREKNSLKAKSRKSVPKTSKV